MTTEPPPVPRRSPRAVVTVRTRVLGAVLVLAALALAASGATAYLLQRERVDEIVDAALERNLSEFRTLAAEGVDPSTGQPFTTTSGLLYTALERTVPARNEGMLAVVDGRVTWVAARTVQVRPEDDPELVAAAGAAEGGDTAALRTVRTAATTYRVLTVPVAVRGDESTGVLLMAFDRPAEHAELVRTYRTYALVSLASLVVLGAVAWVVAGRLLRPIRLLRETAQQITDSDLSERIPVTGDDDLSDLARTLNAMLDRLERAFTAQRRLLDDAGHELRTPLTIVRGHLELLDVHDPQDARATRDLVIDEVDRMHGLVDDLVVLATVDRPDFVQPRATDVGRLTDDVLDKARTLGSHRWLVTGRADVEALVDDRRLTQAWLQLAANAAKFAPDGTPVRLASTLVGTPTGAAVRLSVEDEGPGVAAEDSERIFERFARGSVGRGVEGSGLGLGRRRPRARRPSLGREPDGTARHRRTGRPVPARGARDEGGDGGRPCRARDRGGHAMSQILIAEDEERIASFLAKGLKAAGYAPVVVGTGREAFDLAQSGDVDLLVLDLGLPDQDGVTVLRRLRESGNTVPVIVLTARSSLDDTLTVLEGGADDYMAKPFRFEELLARIRLRLRQDAGAGDATVLTHGNLSLDLRSRRARDGEREVDLSAREFALAEAFLRNPGQVLSREQLLSRVWGYDFDPGSNVVDVYVRYLRRKLGAESVRTVRGMGYRLADEA